MAKKAKAVPKGLGTITSNLVYADSGKAIEFYAKAFGAKELMRMATPDGKGVWHAEVKIGDSILFLSDESPMGMAKAPSVQHPPTASIQLYVRDCDKAFAKAVAAGAKVAMPLMDMFWGDRMGTVVDPFGHAWMISTHQKDLTKKQMRKAMEEFVRQMSAPAGADQAAQGGDREK